MATNSYNVTGTWASVVSGPKDLNLCAPRSQPIIYRVAGSTPSASSGHFLPAGATHPILVAEGENLYLRLADVGAGTFTAFGTDAAVSE